MRRLVRHASAGLLGIASLVLVALVAVLLPVGPTTLERGWAELMVDIRTPVLTHVALALNWLGRGIGRVLLVTVAGVLLLAARRSWAALTFVLVEAITPLATSLVRAAVGRPRPPGGLVHPSGTSFPSGHTSFAAATCVALVLLLGRRRMSWALAVAATAAMAWSRTYLDVHWLLDVAGGALLGVGVALSVFAAVSDGMFTRPLHRGR